mmetsp:Transcript_1504/g.3579  ORF Transcript_1504/g.3579 Transcript_1504/m.3579 type:complete len:257 (+) Transcript_1504:28-798(+)
MGGFEKLGEEAIVDVMKMYTRSSKIKNVPMPSMSNAACALKDALAKDPYSLLKMNNLGYQYWKDGQSEQCLNVLMRGWKRANEIPDEGKRFNFLMKVCELSFGFWKFKQALAVFRDIIEPVDEKFLKPYLILGTQVWAANGDLQQSLKFFQRSIENESFKVAVRVLAIVALELKKAGAFEAAKSSIENLAGDGASDHPDILMVAEFCESHEDRKKENNSIELKQRAVLYGGVGMGVMIILMFLYWLESSSLAKMKV